MNRQPMKTLRERAGEVTSEEGLIGICRRGLRYCHSRVTSTQWLLGWGYLIYWRLRYGVPLRAGARSAINLGWRGDERAIIHDLLARLRPTDVFYDVGAHTGLYTALVASVLPADRVVAFEPYDEYADELERYLEQLGLAATVIREGIGPTETEKEYDPSLNVEDLSEDEGEPAPHQSAVREANVDERIRRGTLPRPTVVKIDVAGAEYNVLQGLEDSLSDSACRLVYCEIHAPAAHRPSLSDFGGSISGVFEFFLERGYDVDIVTTPRATEFFIRAERPISAD